MSTANQLLVAACTSGISCLDEMNLLRVIAQGAMSGGGGGGIGMAIGGAVTSGTPGSVLFIGAGGVMAQDNANFFWDDTNNRLGLGTNAPMAVLDVLSPSLTRVHINSGNSTGLAILALYNENQSNEFDLVQFGSAFAGTTSGVANAGNIFFLALPATAFTFGTYNASPVNITTNSTIRAVIASGGNFGIGQTTPTAVLHLKAGTATAGTAPLKLAAGTNLTTLEIGAVEFTDDATNGHAYMTMNVAGVLTRREFVFI